MSKNGEITPGDILALRDACRARYEQLHELTRDSHLPLEARDVLLRMANEVMAAWEKLPDDGWKAVPR